MRLLPRSARGTALLAAALWPAATAALWACLPVLPRVAFPPPGTGREFAETSARTPEAGVSPSLFTLLGDGRTLLLKDLENGAWVSKFWDYHDGRAVMSLPYVGRVAVASADGRWLASVVPADAD